MTRMVWSRRRTAIGARGTRPNAAALGLATMALVSLLPFAAASIPSMGDWPGHVGRYHVMLHAGDPGPLVRYYVFHWLLLGNLGGDLAVRAIGGWLGAERAAWLVTASIPPLTILGIAAVSRALHGRVQAPAAIAACFVLGNPFLFGFVNYCLAVALALLVFAGWIALAERPVWRRLIVLTPAVLAVWIAHAMGWAVLALLVAGFEGVGLWRDRRPEALGRSAAMALAFVPPIVLTLAWSQGGAGGLSGYRTGIVVRKLMAWVVMLRGGDPLVDIGTTLVLVGVSVWLVWRGAVRIDWRLGAGAVLTAAMVVVVPTTIFGSWGADERLAPVAAIAAAASLRWVWPERTGRALTIAVAMLFAGRTGVVAAQWHRLDTRYAASLHALDHVPRGARIEALVLANPCHAGWRQTAWPHLAALAIPRRDALVNVEWPVAGAPMLRVVYPWPDGLRYDPSQMVDAFDCAGRFTPAALRARLASLPAGRLDYVWLLGTHGQADPWPGHLPVHASADDLLYATP